MWWWSCDCWTDGHWNTDHHRSSGHNDLSHSCYGDNYTLQVKEHFTRSSERLNSTNSTSDLLYNSNLFKTLQFNLNINMTNSTVKSHTIKCYSTNPTGQSRNETHIWLHILNNVSGVCHMIHQCMLFQIKQHKNEEKLVLVIS